MILKKKSRKNIRQFLVDTNLFIAAVKNPKKETKSLRLLLELINDTNVILIGNEFLIMEMEKYAKVFESDRGKEILHKLMALRYFMWVIGNSIVPIEGIS